MSTSNNGGACFVCSSCHRTCSCCHESVVSGVCTDCYNSDVYMNLDEGILFHGYEAVYQGNVFSHTISFTNNGNATPTVIWSSSNTGVVTVDPQTGEIRAKQPGNATVTVSIPCNGRFASLPIEVIPAFCLYPDPSGTVNKGQTFEIRKICPAYSDETEKRVGDPSVLEYTNTCVKTVGAGTTSFTVSARPTSEDYEPIDVTYIFSVRGVRLVDESGKVLSAGEGLYPGENKIFYAEGHNMDGYCEINLCANTEELSITCCCDNDPYKFMVSASNSLIDVENAKLILTGEGRDYYDRTVYDFPVKGIVGPDVYIISNSGNGLPLSCYPDDTLYEELSGNTGTNPYSGTLFPKNLITEFFAYDNFIRVWKIVKSGNYYKLKMGSQFVKTTQFYDSENNLKNGFGLSSNSNEACEFEITRVGNASTECKNLYQFKFRLNNQDRYISPCNTNDTDNILADENPAIWRIEKVHGGKLVFGFDLSGSSAEDQTMVENAGYSFAAKYIGGHNSSDDINQGYINDVLPYNNNTFRIVSLFERNLQQISAVLDDDQDIIVHSNDGDTVFYIMRDPEGCAEKDVVEALQRAGNVLLQPNNSAIYFAVEPHLLDSGIADYSVYIQKIAIGCYRYLVAIQEYLENEQNNPNNYQLGFYCAADLYNSIISYINNLPENCIKPTFKYLLAGSSSGNIYPVVNHSDKYHIRQTRSLFGVKLNEEQKYVTDERRYGNFFNNDNEMTYKTLDELGAWR